MGRCLRHISHSITDSSSHLFPLSFCPRSMTTSSILFFVLKVLRNINDVIGNLLVHRFDHCLQTAFKLIPSRFCLKLNSPSCLTLSRAAHFLYASIIFRWRVRVMKLNPPESYGNPDCQASEAFAKHIAASYAETCDVCDLSLGWQDPEILPTSVLYQ